MRLNLAFMIVVAGLVSHVAATVSQTRIKPKPGVVLPEVILFERVEQGSTGGQWWDTQNTLWLMDTDGSNKRKIQGRVGMGISKRDPCLSFDGKMIVYAGQMSALPKDRGFDICTMDPKGGSFRRLTKAGNNRQPTWSHDGKRIAFAHMDDDEFGRKGIYMMNADGSDVKRIPNIMYGAHTPVWSPDGKKPPVYGCSGGTDWYKTLFLHFRRQQINPGYPLRCCNIKAPILA